MAPWEGLASADTTCSWSLSVILLGGNRQECLPAEAPAVQESGRAGAPRRLRLEGRDGLRSASCGPPGVGRCGQGAAAGPGPPGAAFSAAPALAR